MNYLRRTITPEKALSRLEDLCARSEQSTGEALRKLTTWGISPGDAAKIISSLVNRRFIDDERYCHAYIKDKFRFARWGKRKIYAALLLKHIDKNLINQGLEEIDDDEYYNTLIGILKAKARTIRDADTYEGRTRLFRFAVSRGFETELISRAIRDLNDQSA